MITGTLRDVDWLLGFFYVIAAAELGASAWMNVRHRRREQRDREQVVSANLRIIFPACTRAHARRMAEDWPGTTSFLSRKLKDGFAWYAVRSTATGETITSHGWCRTRRGCDRVRTQIRSQAAADMRSAATRLPAA